jgi:hypothetical protein
MLIREAASGRAHLPFTWNRGMLMSSSFYNSRKIMARRNRELETYSMLYGSLTCS